uniref:UDP-glucuronosyltransferase 2B31 n=1 Tax=Lygus hesperus TaxID=30085 RepID=A0A0A9YWE5_LYGHE
MKFMFTEDPQIKKLLASNETYDIVLGEFNLYQELNSVWIHKFNATAITLLPLGDYFFANEFNGLPDNPAYMVDWSSFFTDKMSFVERLINTVDFIGSTVVNYYYISVNQHIANELAIYPGWETRPPLVNLMSDVALVLVNSHHSVGYAYPKAPHVKEIGGMTLTGSTELPQDLKSFMDNATDGVIYISLGSNVDMNHMTRGKIEEFAKRFRSLKQRVLLKWFGNAFPKIDDPNIRIQRWFPQLGILDTSKQF